MKKYAIAWLLTISIVMANAQTINRLEYFIDTDNGVGKNTLVDVTAAADGTFPFTVSLASTTTGYHTLYVRARDNNGKWGITSRQSIQVLPANNKSLLTTGEYFFDTDPGIGAANAITVSTQDSVITQIFTAAVTSLPPGYHKLYTRVKDSYGNWGQSVIYSIEVTKSTGTEYIAAIEYFFITDAGVSECPSLAVATPFSSGSYSFNIPRNQIPGNAKRLFLRVRDSADNHWSLTQFIPPMNNAVASTVFSDNLVENAPVSFIVMPNPAHDVVNIALQGFQKSTDVRITITDMSGKTVLLQKTSAASNIPVNLVSLARGIYFVNLVSGNYSGTQKLIIQ